MQFRVSEVRQRASGGSTVVKYFAEVDFAPGEGTAIVSVESTIPDDADAELLRQTVDAIRRGAESALRPLGLNAKIGLRELFIHDVDCSPDRFEKVTAEKLAVALAEHPT
jgi:hypothetical protein